MWLTRVGPHPSDAAALRVEIAPGGDAADGWVTPRALAKGLEPAPEEGPLSGLTSVRKSIEKLTEPSPRVVEHYSRRIANFALRGDPYADEPVELVPGTDLVLEEEVVMAEQIACAWFGCADTFEQKAVGDNSGRPWRYCPKHRGKKDHRKRAASEPSIDRVTPEEVVRALLPRPMAKYRAIAEAEPAPPPAVAPRNTPYDAVIADLLVKREQLDRAIDALREIAGAA